MSHWFRNAAWATLLGGAVAVGCQHATGPDAYPKDPLLLSKKPVEGLLEPKMPPAVLLAAAEPLPPQPSEALVKAFQLRVPPAPMAVQPLQRDRSPTAATLTGRTRSAFGHAPDHSWLLGVLERQDQGRLELRFCDAEAGDRLGGKVSLEPDPRLQQFHDGDVVRVEGELTAGLTEPGQSRSHYPRYRIRDVQLVQRRR